MKKTVLLLIALATIASCKSRQDEALKSADKTFILTVANEQFANKKWSKALALYERLTNLVAGTDDAPNVVFNSAYANYYDKNYQIAGHQFKNFSVSFPQDARREEAAYMSALCYYQGSMDYNLDQTSTEQAINELQNFINRYPDSEKAKNIDQLIDELSYKLEFKAFENARQYYKMANYKAADIAMENFMDDFPATKLKEKAMGIQLDSKYQLAMNSVFDLKEDRLEAASLFAKQVEKEFPNSSYATEAKRMITSLEKEKARFQALKKEIQDNEEKFKQKQARLTQKEAEKKMRNTQKALSDSVKINTPPTGISLPIQN